MSPSQFLRLLFKSHKVIELPGRIQGLELRIKQLERQLRYEIDLSRSAQEVPEELVSDFRAWKVAHVLPAEPLVSVIIATYNRAKLLTERAIPSVLQQTYRNLELIVVGDGCTDETVQQVGRIKDPRLRFVNLPNRDHYPSDPYLRWLTAGTKPCNLGIGMARGDFLTHLDDDDEYLPNRLEVLLEFCKSTKCDLVWHPFWYETSDGKWAVNEAADLTFGSVTSGAYLCGGWFKNIEVDPKAYKFREPGDWNRLRRIQYVGADCQRCPEPLMRHFAERRQPAESPTPAGSRS